MLAPKLPSRPADARLWRFSKVVLTERQEGGGEELPQRRAQPQQVPGPLPDQLLVCSGYHLDRLGLVGVASDQAQLVSIGAHHVRQRVRIRCVTFRAGDAVSFPVAATCSGLIA